MTLTGANFFQILLMLLSLLLGYYLLSTRRAYALGGFFILLTIHNAFRLAVSTGYIPPLFDISHAFRFIYGVLIFFFVRELLHQRYRFRRGDLLHLLPFLLAAALPLLTEISARHLGPLAMVALLVYLLASYQAVFHYRRVLGATRSSGTPEAVTWLLRALNIYALLLLFEISRYMLGFFIPEPFKYVPHLFFIGLSCVLLSILIFQGLRNPSLLPGINLEEKALVSELARRKSRQLPSAGSPLEQQLTRFMSEKKPFLNPHLSLGELAEEMNTPARGLSELINDLYGCNFSEYINRARIVEAQAIMRDANYSQQSLLEIGLAAGFNSKTSFNVMFKRFVGQTPSNYRKSLSS